LSQPVLAALAAGLVATFGSCFAEIRSQLQAGAPRFEAPAQGELALVGTVQAVVVVPAGELGPLAVRLDGVDVSSAFAPSGGNTWKASLDVPDEGPHELVGEWGPGSPSSFSVSFRTLELENPDACEVLNDWNCLLPYPSSRFLARAPTPTGYRIELPAEGMPDFFNADLSRRVRLNPIPYRALDGFSPAVQVIMHFPGGVDPALSNASRLLPATRSYDTTSLEPDSPTLLIDADTGEPVLHFIEPDARAVSAATGDPLPNQVLFLRPAEHLRHGHRYVVAVRRLVHPDGSPVEPEPVFAALRDGTPTAIPGVERRRRDMKRIFGVLRDAGLSEEDLGELQLAFDFVVASQENTTGEMLSMRDQAFAWLAGQEGPTFSVNAAESVEYDCALPGQAVWRIVRGTFQSPLFLSRDPALYPQLPGYLVRDLDGNPVVQGLEDAPFAAAIPCAARTAEAPAQPVVIGHGLGMTGRGIIDAIVEGGGDFGLGLENVLAATDWHGLSGPDFDGVIQLEGFLGSIFGNFDRFRALPDRLRQAELNTLVLARLLREGRFNADPWFQGEQGQGLLPGGEERALYYGVSLGGIYGLFLSALTPDIERFNIDVGASNFSMLLSRAQPFEPFEELLLALTQPDVTVQAIGIGLFGELWTRGEPAGYVSHVTGANDPPLPGSIPKKILMTVARFDHQVSNQASEITARTLRIPSLVGSAEPGKPGIPDLEGPLDSALVYYDAGGLVPGIQDDYIPPLDNRRVAIDECDPHSERLATPASIDQLVAFLQPGGQIENFCDGLCDGRDGGGDFYDYEIPFGDAVPCIPIP
jgi:hypothetical protein